MQMIIIKCYDGANAISSAPMMMTEQYNTCGEKKKNVCKLYWVLEGHNAGPPTLQGTTMKVGHDEHL